MKLCALLAAMLVCPTMGAWADTVALTSSRTAGNQPFSGVLGMDFFVSSSITVTQLGAFDSGQDGFIGTIQVGIFNRNTQALVGSLASFSGLSQPLTGSSRFLDVPDFLLAPGNYSVVAVGFSSGDLNGNVSLGGSGPTVGSGGGLISFVGSSRWGTSPLLSFPSNVDSGSPTLYDAGTFQFTSAVPESGTGAQMVAGLTLALVLAGSGRRRRARGASASTSALARRALACQTD